MRSMVEGLQIRHLDICGAFVGFRVVARNDGDFFVNVKRHCQFDRIYIMVYI